MAGRTAITSISVSRAGLTAILAPSTAADATNGNVVANDGATVLIMLNSDSATHTLTVQLAGGVDGATAGPKTYTLPVSATRQWVGVFPVQYFGNQLLFNVDSALVNVQAVSLLGP